MRLRLVRCRTSVVRALTRSAVGLVVFSGSFASLLPETTTAAPPEPFALPLTPFTGIRSGTGVRVPFESRCDLHVTPSSPGSAWTSYGLLVFLFPAFAGVRLAVVAVTRAGRRRG